MRRSTRRAALLPMASERVSKRVSKRVYDDARTRARESGAFALPASFSSASRGEAARLLLVFLAALVWFLLVALHLIGSIGMTGDEPWYVLQGESLAVYHTLNFAPIQHAPQFYSQFFRAAPTDHVLAVPGTAEKVLPYLPGYAAIIGPLYVLGGRTLVVVVQSLAAAGTAALVYLEARNLWRSLPISFFATLAYATALPVALFAGQLFPSTFASLAALGAFTLLRRALPVTTGGRRMLVAAAIGALCLLLPWLHVRYALLALAIAAAALLTLSARLPWMRRLLARLPGNTGFGEPTPDADDEPPAYPWSTALVIVAPTLISFAGVVWYSKRYFGTWFPQYSAMGAGAYTAPRFANILRLYGQMFFEGQSGLVPWVPLLLLAPVGIVLLARRRPLVAACMTLWILGLLGSFLSAAVAPHVSQAFALPARFSVETVPYLALAATAGVASARPILRVGIGPLAAQARIWRSVTHALGVAIPVVLLLADVWLTIMAQLAPALLYPSANGVRIDLRFPHLLPIWWFALFAVHHP